MRQGKQPSGRMIDVGRAEAQYRAFVPNALPPVVEFSSELVLALSDADRALGELAGLGRGIPEPQLLIRPFIRREAVLSSRIEGTLAGLEDLYQFEAGARGSTHPDVAEVANYVRALEYGLERVFTLPLSLRLVRELHQKLMEGVRGGQSTPGEFRRSQNWIGRPGCTLNEATYVPPPVPQMQDALAAFETYLHSDDVLPPLIRIAAIHYQFESIHPFLDGNGRVGRLIISLLLAHWDLLSLPLLYLSAYFERNRQEYYDRLLAVSMRSAWQDWLLFFLRGVTAESRDASKRIKMLQDLQAGYRETVMRLRASALPLRILDLLFATPVITARQAQNTLGVSYNGARLAIGKLVDAGILHGTSDETYGREFIATGILHALE